MSDILWSIVRALSDGMRDAEPGWPPRAGELVLALDRVADYYRLR